MQNPLIILKCERARAMNSAACAIQFSVLSRTEPYLVAFYYEWIVNWLGGNGKQCITISME